MFIGNKKCRIYAACGVSQTPKYIEKLRGCKINQQEFEKFDCEIIVTTVKNGKDIDYCALNYNRQFCKTVTEKDIWDKNYCFEEKINFAA